MRIVVADTTPLNYLALIGQIQLLQRLFETVSIPDVVSEELNHSRTPAAVREWISTRPSWLHVVSTPSLETLPLPKLDKGERAAIALAVSLHADLLLMDDRAGIVAAEAQGFRTAGTLGILDLAARRGFIDLAAVFDRLRNTTFRCRPEIMQRMLADFEEDRRVP